LGLGSWDPAAKTHMMAYDKQLKDFYNDVRRGSNSLVMEGMKIHFLMVVYSKYESSLHFWASNNKEQLKGWYEYWKHKKIPVHPKQAYALSYILT
jgi:hypothetical protein